MRKRALFRRLGPACHYCKQEFSLELLTVDHIIPMVFGGPSLTWNAVLACRKCNEEKGLTVGLCTCDLCKRAINTFLMYYREYNGGRRHHGRLKRRTPEAALEKIKGRIIGVERSLEIVGDDPIRIAGLRGYAHGLRTALDILRTVEAKEARGDPQVDISSGAEAPATGS